MRWGSSGVSHPNAAIPGRVLAIRPDQLPFFRPFAFSICRSCLVDPRPVRGKKDNQAWQWKGALRDRSPPAKISSLDRLKRSAPVMATMLRFPVAQLTDITERLVAAMGTPPEIAAQVAEMLVGA